MSAVAFLDFDQELHASRYRAGEEALALLARASRLVGGRRRGGRVLVQTRSPSHPVLAAAQRGSSSWLPAVERPVRKALRLPPYTALAVLSGPGAAELASRLEGLQATEVEISPQDSERFAVRAPSARQLSDALAATGHPEEVARVEVGPVRF